MRGDRSVTERLAFSAARLADVTFDEMIAGRFAKPGTCPHCGKRTDVTFADEETIVE